MVRPPPALLPTRYPSRRWMPPCRYRISRIRSGGRASTGPAAADEDRPFSRTGWVVDVAPPRVSGEQARAFLNGRFDSPADLEPLTGGFWSSAYGFSAGGRELVVRFGQNVSWFEADRAAMAFASPHLPVPEVLDVGPAFDGA